MKGAKYALLIASLCFIFMISSDRVLAQPCSASTPSFTIDLTGSPSGTWSSPLVSRAGQCCTTVSPHRCIEFIVTLDPAAVGVILRKNGALAWGSGTVELNCMSPTSWGDVLCLNGVGPHRLTYCEPGSNAATYTIESVDGTIAPFLDVIGEGCSSDIDLITDGSIDYSTLTWTNTSGNDPGANYISGKTTSTPTFTGPAGTYTYDVCAQISAGTCTFTTFVCSEVTITVVPSITVTVPDGAFCTGGSYTATATVSPGGSYVYEWYSASGGGGTLLNSGFDITSHNYNTPGTKSVRVYDTLYGNCFEAIEDFIVTENPLPTAVINGPTEVCDGGTLTFTANNAGSGATYSWNFGAGASPGTASGIGPHSVTYNSCANNTVTLTVVRLGCTNMATHNLTPDVTPPTFTVPPNLTINCTVDYTDLSITGDVTDEMDNCSPGLDATYSDVIGLCVSRLQTITRTWSLTDACGNTTNQNQLIVLQDQDAPSFTEPPDITLTCNDDPNDLMLTGDVTDEADNCQPGPLDAYIESNVFTPYGCSGTGEIRRRWRLDDGCGNTTVKFQTIYIIDNTPPTMPCPNPGSYECISQVPAIITTLAAYEAAFGNVTDDCNVDPNSFTYAETSSGTCPTTITRTYTIADDCGNTSSCMQTITVLDVTDPTFTDPADITIFVDALCNYNADPSVTGDVTDENDNCAIGLNATYSDVTVPGTCQGETVITRTWSLVDDCGNSAPDLDQIITVQDTTSPTFTLPVDATIYADANCNYNSDPSITGDVSISNDNCAPALTSSYIDVTNPGSCEGEVIISRQWTVQDACMNISAVQVQTITVLDTISPTFSIPSDVTIYADANCNYNVGVGFTGDVTDEADNCTTVLDATFVDGPPVPGSCEGEWSITRTWSLVDDCGNAASNQFQTIFIEDTTRPTFTRPADITIFVDGACNYNADPSITGDVTDEADNCTTILDATYSDNVTPGTCPGNWTITRTWSLVDDCNNAANDQIQTITVEDNTIPTFTVPVDYTIYVDDNCNYNADPTVTGEVTVSSDNCSATITPSYTDATNPGSCEGQWIITRTWTVEDQCSNISAAINQTITVLDTTRPTFTIPADITLYADASCNYDVSVGFTGDVTDEADNCTTVLDATFVDGPPVPGACQGEWSITRTWSLVDDCGNAANNQFQTIFIEDTTRPTFTRPADITIYVDGACNYNADPSITGDVTDEADNCTTILNATYADNTVPGLCPGNWTITRTWSLVDDCGNAADDQDQTITVQDTTRPTFTVPVDFTIYADDNCNYDSDPTITGEVTVTSDNCSGTITPAYTDATNPGTCEGQWIITRTWTVSDPCSNISAAIDQTITVLDTTRPTFTIPADITLYADASCNYDISIGFTGDVTDEADNCTTVLDATFVDGPPVPGACQGEWSITRTWSLVDDCGNAANNQFQTIFIEDTIRPTFTRPADITIYVDGACNYNADPSITGDVTDEADNCTTILNATYADNTVPGLCPGNWTITRTWSLVDDCGNAANDQDQIITVQDTTRPTFTVPVDFTIYADDNCNYDSDPTVTGEVTVTSDNCSGTITPAYTDATNPGTCEGQWIITRTWTVSDPCSNISAAIDQTITVLDTTRPTFTVPGDITIYTDALCNYDVSVGFTGDVTDEADNCTTVLDATFVDGPPIAGACQGEWSITRTWSLVDDCGNVANDQFQTIFIEDTTRPTFTVPGDITIYADNNCNYDASIGITGDVTDEADNCTTILDATSTDVTANGTCEGEWIITRTWSLIDDCGNAANDQDQTITVQDTTRPTFTRPADITIYADATCAYDITVGNTGDVTDEADNCTSILDATFVDAPPTPGTCEGEWIITRTWSLIDGCLNAANDQIQTITVEDTTRPTFTVPGDITIYADANCNYDVSVGFTGDVTDEADNCTTILDATFVDGAPVAGTCVGEWIITRTWSLVDDCGNNANDQFQTITVEDTTRPTFTVPGDITIYADGACNYDASIGFTGDVTDEADNCTTILDATSVDGAPVPGSCEGEWIITRTWSLVDDCGNAANDQDQTITVQDTTRPTFTRPADITIYADDVCVYDIDVSNTGDVTDEADNCTTVLDATFVDGAPVAGACEGAWIITRTWSLVDDCLNAANDQFQTITVQDTTRPTFTAPGDVTIYADASCNYDITVGFTGDVTDEADNCTTVLDATFVDGAPVAGACEGEWTITRTWSLVDDCGNAANDQFQTITVEDTTRPTFTVPGDITIYADGACNYDASIGFTGDVTDEADNCTTILDATSVDGAPVPGSCEGEWIITRTWSLVDNCGNAANDQDQTITVQDTTRPTFTRPADITIYADDVCVYDIDVSNTGDVTDEADNCTTVLDATFVDGAPVAGACEGAWIITRTWSLVDDCLNAANDQFQTITVQDTTRPTFTAPGDVTIYADASCNYDITVGFTGDVTDEADNCTTVLDATFVDGVPVAGTCEGEWTITRTWSLVDDCGNAANDQFQTITVEDTTRPTFTVPGDITIYADGACNYDASIGFTGDVTDEADNCTTVLDATFVDGAPVAGSCEGEWIITRTWSLVDNCGNTTGDQDQTITVQDTTRPTFTRPADITIYADDVCVYDIDVSNTGDVTDEADNCTTVLDATFVDGVPVAGSCEGAWIITRTWSLVDDCLNAANDQIQTITVQDTTRPTFTAPGDITIYADADCNYDVSVGNTGDVTDEADNCTTVLDATFVDGAPVAGACEGEWTITRTWSLVDDCGNAANDQFQTITVEDTTRPTFTVPGDITIYADGACNYDASIGFTGDVTDEADNCTTVLDATFVDGAPVAGSCEGEWIITRTWSLVDNCGNTTGDQDQTITVQDTTRPTFTRPADITIYADDVCVYDIDVSNTGDVTDEADNCTTVLDATFVDGAPVAGSCEGAWIITRTWSLIDDCLNAANDQIQTITVQDTTRPTFTAPGDITIYADADCNYDVSVGNTGDVTDEADNCTTVLDATFVDGAPVAGTCEGEWTITRTWSLVDDCGNAANDQFQTITVEDTTRPTFTVPGDITIYADGACNYDASIGFTGDVTDEADNCTTVLDATFVNGAPVAGSCEGEWIITRTWSLVDNCGNTTGDQDQTITVQDTTRPTFTRPPDITIYADDVCVYDIDVSNTGDVTDEADNCTTVLDATFVDGAPVAGACEGEWIITRTWSLIDDCLNAANDQIQTITVQDTTRPTFTAPGDITIYADADCNYDVSVGNTGDVTDEADNCTTVLDATFVDDAPVPGSCEGEFTITRTWSLVDDCGNAAPDLIQFITVEDTISPTFTAPGDITVYFDAGCGHDISTSVTGDVTDENDNCTTSLDATFTDVTVPGSCGNELYVTRTWSLIDNCGNLAGEQIQNIVVTDTTSPILVCPPNVTMDCPADTTIFNTGTATASDNCLAVTITYSDDVTPGGCYGAFTVARTWSAVDECGITTTCIQTIEVIDVTDPTFTVPADITIACDQDPTDLTLVGDVTDESDGCSTSLDATYSDNSVIGCNGSGVITRTWTLIDECGNTTVQVQTITILDDQNPQISCPSSIEAVCSIAEIPPYTDLTDFLNNGGTVSDNCGIDPFSFALLTEVSDGNSCPEVIVRTYIISDLCGNITSCNQVITINDTINPVINNAPGDVTVVCDAIPDVPILNVDITASDNCSTPTFTFSEITLTGICENTFSIERTWTAIDDCGNTTSTSQLITVIDCQPEVSVTASANPICEGGSTILTAIVNNNYSTPVYQWQFSDDGINFNDISGATSTVLNITSASIWDQGFYRIVISDNAGNLGNPDCNTLSETLYLTINQTAVTVLDETICQGDSYTVGTQTFSSSGSYTIVLLTSEGCDSVVDLNLTVLPPIEITLNEIICEGESYAVGSSVYTTSGSYTDHLITAGGCDSIVNLNLEVKPNIIYNIDTSICAGESITIGGQTFSTTDNYVINLATIFGCDSIINLNLNVIEPVIENITAQICDGQTYLTGGQTFNTTGTYTINTIASSGCDSIIELDLTVDNTIYNTIGRTICDGDTYSFGNTSYSTSGTYIHTFQSSAGCDSVVTLNLDVVEQIFVTLNETICDGESFEVGSQSFDQSGTYIVSMTSSGGCDSTVTLNLTVAPVYDMTSTQNICQGDFVSIGGQTFNQTGIYDINLTTSQGCDSIIHLDLTVHPVSSQTLPFTMCEGETFYGVQGQYTQTGIYTETFQSSVGCDSIIVYDITVNPVYDISVNHQICQGESYSVGNNSYSTTGMYIDTLQSAKGCDSIVRLDLAVLQQLTTDISAQICQGDSYTLGTSTYNSSGTYTETFISQAGCDSVVTLTLDVLENLTTDISTTICSGEIYVLGSQSLTSTGTYSETFTSNSGCDSIVTVDLTVLNVISTTITETICSGNTYFFNNQNLSSTGTYKDTLVAAAGCDSIVTLQLSVLPAKQKELNVQICDGSSYDFNGETITTSGVYMDTLPSANGCDSIITLQLQVLPVITETLDIQICLGQTFYFNNQDLNVTGTYFDTTQTSDGCDSITTLNLQVLPALSGTDNIQICLGQTYMFNNQELDVTGTYYDTVLTSGGCDSIITLNLEVLPVLTGEENVQICQGQSYFFNNQNLNTTGTYYDTLLTPGGCDSIATLNLEILPVLTGSETVQICLGQTYNFNNQDLDVAGTYYDTVVTSGGCDSIITLNLEILPVLTGSETVQICLGQTYNFNNQNLDAAGTYYDTVVTGGGCDSIITLNLEILPVLSGSESIQICQGQVYTFNNQDLNASGTYLDTLQTTAGCDSIVTLTLLVLDVLQSTDSVQICEGQTYTFDGNSLNTSGTYTGTFQTSYGCDSVVTLVLEVLPELTTNINQQICDGQTYLFDGNDLNTTGTYTATFSTSAGCDSIVTLNLSVVPTLTETLNITLCEGESYDFSGSSRTTSGTYIDSLISSSGCDSIVTLNLTINENSHHEFTIDICAGETYEFINETLSIEGQYIDTITAANGCDSIITLNLNVLPTFSETITAQICSGQTYMFNGDQISAAGVYTANMLATGGCDSIITLDLRVDDVLTTQIDAQICSGQSYDFNGLQITTAGTYIDSLTSASGCDSIVTLNLTISDVITEVINKSICQGSSYEFNNETILVAGTYSDTLTSVTGCDSVVILNLEVKDVLTETVDLQLCQGQSFQFNGSSLTTSGTYVDTIVSSLGCDSIVTLNLTVNDVLTDTLREQICTGSTFDFNGKSIGTAGTYDETFTSTNGCDSVVTLILTVNDVVTTDLNATICAGQTYDFNGQSLTDAGTYSQSLTTTSGCDSIINLQLAVTDVITESQSISICTGDSLFFNDQWIKSSGSYADTLTSSSGCDSIITLNLQIIEAILTTVNELICQGQSYSFNGMPITEGGTYLDTLSAASGCDSIITLNLEIAPVIQDTIYQTVCEGTTVEFNNQSIGTSGIYTENHVTVSGCDSNIVLILTVNNQITTDMSATICDGEKYVFGNDELTSPGSYSQTLIAANGCDSVINLSLTVLPTISTPIERQICTGQTYNFNGQILSTNGTYRDTLTSQSGCDSVLILTLIIDDVISETINQEICEDEILIFDGDTLKSSGTYRDTLPSVAGCDSIAILNLVVHPLESSDLTVELCEGETYSLGNQDFTTSGNYEVVFQTIHGCDSTVNLTIIVNAKSSSEINQSICLGEKYLFNSDELTTSGTYTQILTNAAGCDSTITLHLEVLPTFETEEEHIICEGESVIIDGQSYTAETTFTSTYTAINGCDSTVNHQVTILPEVKLMTTDISICAGESTVLSIDNEENIDIVWSPAESLSCTNCATPQATPEVTTTYTVSTIGCAGDTISAQLTVEVVEMPGLTLPPDGEIKKGESTELNANILNTNSGVNWYDDSGNLVCEDCKKVTVKPDKTTTYTAVAMNELGCQEELSLIVYVEDDCELELIEIANALTPNNDGFNDYFEIINNSISTIDRIQIFNRWGEMVFESTDLSNKWDGTFRGNNVNAGVYVYVVSGRCSGGDPLYISGNVTVIR